MKKWMKTLTALCLTVAMLSTMLVVGVSASAPITVEWYGFDTESVKMELGEGSYVQEPVFFPQDATETTVTWSSDNEAVATVDAATGAVTLVAEGTANITATLTDTTGLVDPTQTAGVSYALEVQPTTGIVGTLKVKPSSAVIQHPGTQSLTVTGAAGRITATSSNTAVATVALDGNNVNITSAAGGYTELTITDGTNTINIPVSVVAVDVVSAKDSWMALYPNAAATTADPGYLQWYFETAPTATAGVLGYDANTAWTVLDAETNYDSSGNRVLFNHLDASKYSNFKYDGGGMTVTNYYHVFTIKMPMDGTVSVGAVGEARFEGTNNTDGSYMAVFKTTDDGSGGLKTNRVFPAGEDVANKQGSYTQEVIQNWLWIYPNGKNVGDAIYSKTLAQTDVDALVAFNKDGAVFDVKKDDVIRVVLHAGENNYSDSGIRYVPAIEYVVDNLIDVIDLDREVSVARGQTATLSPRVNPYWMTPEVELLNADGTASSDVLVDTVSFRDGSELGTMDIVLEGVNSGEGYYRLNFGTAISRLIKVDVATTDLELEYTQFRLGRLRWKVTNTTNAAVPYTSVLFVEQTNTDGSIKIDTSTIVQQVNSAAAGASGTTIQWNIGNNTYDGQKGHLFFFTDIDNLKLPSPAAFATDIEL